MEGFIDIESAGVEAFFRECERATGKPVGKFIRERSGALARYFAEATQPVAGLSSDPNESAPDGISIKAKQLGQNAVRRDINRVYSSPSATFKVLRDEHGIKSARAFYAMISNGDFEGARVLLASLGMKAQYLDIMAWDAGARHRQMRNARGRVNRGVKPSIVSDKKSLADYMKTIIKRVGWAKSAWIAAAKMIQGSKIGRVPTWMKQSGSPGVGTDKTSDPNQPHVTLQNNVKYIGDLVDDRAILRAQTSFEESLAKEIEIILEKEAAKTGGLVTTRG